MRSLAMVRGSCYHCEAVAGQVFSERYRGRDWIRKSEARISGL